MSKKKKNKVAKLSEEAYNIFSYLDGHGYKTYDKECCAVFGNADVENQCHKEPNEEEGVE